MVSSRVSLQDQVDRSQFGQSLAAQRRDADLADGTLIAAYCPGMINTPTSGAFWDFSNAQAPDQAAVSPLDLLLSDIDVPANYGQLVQGTTLVPWKP